jgi:hypothetical protein
MSSACFHCKAQSSRMHRPTLRAWMGSLVVYMLVFLRLA